MRSQFPAWRQGLRFESLEDRSLPAGDFLGLMPVEQVATLHGQFNDNDHDTDDSSTGLIYVGMPNVPVEQGRPMFDPLPIPVRTLHSQDAPLSQPGMMPPAHFFLPNLVSIHDLSNSPAETEEPEPFHLLMVHLDSTAPDLELKDHPHEKFGPPLNPNLTSTVSPFPLRVPPDHSHLLNSQIKVSNSNVSSLVNSAIEYVAVVRNTPNPNGLESTPTPQVTEGISDAKDSAERRQVETDRTGREEVVEFPTTLPALISRAIPVDLSQIEATAQQYLQQIANMTPELPEGMDWVDLLWMSTTALFLGGVACVGWIEHAHSRRKRLNTPLVQHLSEIEQPI